MCFKQELTASELAIAKVLWLSQRIGKSHGAGILRDVRSRCNQSNSRIMWHIDIYLASVEDKAMVRCLVADQDTRAKLRKTI